MKKGLRTNIPFWILVALVFGSFNLIHSEGLLAAKSDVRIEADSGKAVNVNKAGLEELQTVRGIGPALAERIIQYRDEHGVFKQIEDLAHVRGIGGSKLEKIRNQVSI